MMPNNENELPSVDRSKGGAEPMFSILLPVVKTQYFKEAFESAASQTFPDYEIVVLDNIADADVSFVLKNEKTSLIRNKERLSMRDNHTKGLSLCKGRWIHILSDDDILDKTLLDELAKLIKEHDSEIDIISTRFVRIDENRNIVRFSALGMPVMPIEEYLYYRTCFSLSALTVRKTASDQISGFDGFSQMGWYMDHHFLIRVAMLKGNIGHINKPLVTHRINLGSVSAPGKKMSVNESIECLKAIISYYEDIEKYLGNCCGKHKLLAQGRTNAQFHENLRGLYIHLSKSGLLATWKLHRTFKTINKPLAKNIWMEFCSFIAKRFLGKVFRIFKG